MCDLAPVLAIHTAEYVNDLLQLTLDKKLHAKLVFFQRIGRTRIDNCARNHYRSTKII
jgi:hypothetical protein